MTRDVVTVSPDATVNETIELLLEHRISGMPVVDDVMQVVGIISEFRLMQAVHDPLLKFSRVAELMTKDVLSVDEETPISAVASLMTWNRIRSVPVLRGGMLVGLISRTDMIRYALETPLAEQLV
jgi:CBS domain-containing protein